MLQLGLGLLQQTVFPAKKAVFTNRQFSLQKEICPLRFFWQQENPIVQYSDNTNSAIWTTPFHFNGYLVKSCRKRPNMHFLDGSCSRMFELFLAADSFKVAVSGFRLLHSLGQSTLGQEGKSCKLRIDILLIDTLKGWHLFSVCRKT